ncbi:MAG: hypothetical protein HY063_13240 [Bacteroidetes bacterium]|nr:hypothetical protein [Bacteroidota bacterium]
MKKLVSYFHIMLHLDRMTISELVSFAFGIKTTGDPDIPSVHFTDAQIQAQAQLVQTEIGSRATDPKPSLTAQEQKDVDKLCRMIVAVKSDVEIPANDKAQGDRSIFDVIARRTGFIPRGISKKHQRVFESLPAEKGSFHVRVPSEKMRGLTYIYEYGITTAENVLPAKWERDISLSVTECIVKGLPPGSMVAVRYAVSKHPAHSKKALKTKLPDSDHAISKVVTVHTVNAQGKVTVTHGVDFLNFSDVIYIVIQ